MRDEVGNRRQPAVWCCRCGLNARPLPYQGSALPLSYGSRQRPNSTLDGSKPSPFGAQQGAKWALRCDEPRVRPKEILQRNRVRLERGLPRRRLAVRPVTPAILPRS